MFRSRISKTLFTAEVFMNHIAHRWRTHRGSATVALNLYPVRVPWGGGNQWASQLVRYLRTKGYSVRFDLKRPVDCILMAKVETTGNATFGLSHLRTFLSRYPHVPCIQRINENDLHRGSQDRNLRLAALNPLMSHTVFVSQWVRDYHAQRWFSLSRPHTVIYNGADSAVFHPQGGAVWKPGEPLRLVTHHWSDNWHKGFDVYRQIDQMIADSLLPQTELWVIGRWPSAIHWRAARTFPPQPAKSLAEILRRCHVYISASRWESGPMHLQEGLQCGLPVLYHEQGGGSVEMARFFGVGFKEDVRTAIEQIRQRYARVREALLHQLPSGDWMCSQYEALILALLQQNSTPSIMKPLAEMPLNT